jgi:two-component system, OmpR family, sensor kinase
LSRKASVRWRLVAWVTGVLILVGGAMLVVIYERATNDLRAQIDTDVAGDVSQLSQAVRALREDSPLALARAVRRYIRAQPFNATSSLLFAVVPGQPTLSNHLELFGSDHPENGETLAEQQQENTEGHALLGGPVGLSTRRAPDLGEIRVDQRIVDASGVRVRVGAGEPLIVVTRAGRSLARSFIIAGAIALVLVLIASYLAGASVSLPLRRMAKVAARVDHGDLQPRMHPPDRAGSEIHVLAHSFNHMLDRLDAAFRAQRDFVADASHELRTPLTVIAGQIEVLAAQPDPPPEAIQRVQRLITEEVARTARLVDEMLFLSQSERNDFLQLQTIDVPEFVTDLWCGVTSSADREFKLSTIPPASLEVDPDRLAQALRNLLRNAIEHTVNQAGLVRLEVTLLPAGWIRFAVSDNGPGIEQEQRERIFERFHRTDRARNRAGGGAGLGLAIVQAIANAHGGRVRVETAVGGGAQFELELPGARRRSSQRGRGYPTVVVRS